MRVADYIADHLPEVVVTCGLLFLVAGIIDLSKTAIVAGCVIMSLGVLWRGWRA